MTCKIDHADPENIPQFLCRVCNPRKSATRDTALAAEDAELEAQAADPKADALREKIKKRRIRKLSNEIDRMEEKLKLIIGREPKALIDKLRASIQAAHQELRKAGG